MAMFAIIFFRLWYLQVLTGEQYVQQANANRVRDLPIPAPRGQILDREGQPIVTSRVTNAVQIVPSALPPAGRPRLALYRRLGALLGMSASTSRRSSVRGRTRRALRAGDDQDRCGSGCADRAGRAPERVPRASSSSRCRFAPTRTARWPRRRWATSARSPNPSSSCAPSTACSRAPWSARKDSSTTTTATCAGGRECSGWRSTRSATPSRAALAPTQPLAGHSLRVTLDLGPSEGGRKGAPGRDRTRQGRGQTGGRGRVHGAQSAHRADPGDRLLSELLTRTSSPNL